MRPAVRRKAVEHVRQAFEISERRACSILGVDRTSMRYAHRRSDDGDLRSRLGSLNFRLSLSIETGWPYQPDARAAILERPSSTLSGFSSQCRRTSTCKVGMKLAGLS